MNKGVRRIYLNRRGIVYDMIDPSDTQMRLNWAFLPIGVGMVNKEIGPYACKIKVI